MKLPAKLSLSGLGVLIVAALFYLLLLPGFNKSRIPVNTQDVTGDPLRGEYIIRMAGCVACHTDVENEGEFLAGGPAIDTQFGTFYAPNITTNKNHGIGGWSFSDLYYALTAGLSPQNEHYYPVFPYTSYHRLKLQDIVDLKAYLDTVSPLAKARRPHKLKWPFTDRRLLGIWKWLNTSDSPVDDSEQMDEQHRGAYLINGPGHCAECHSDRDLLGGIDYSSPLTGNQNGPGGNPVPAIAGPGADINQWEVEDLMLYLQTGIEPDGDAVSGAMSEVINESTSYLSDEDVEAIATYLLNSNQ